ncbi:MAG: type II secretion system protein N [Rubrivivax sp.]
MTLSPRAWWAARASRRNLSTQFLESTLAQAAWQRTRKAVARFGWFGFACGAVVALIVFAPATWLAGAVASTTGQRLLLADARGTVWNGSAVPVLSGGPQSRSAALLPGRLQWSLGLRVMAGALELRLRQDCCMSADAVLLIRPGLGSHTVQLQPGGASLGEWPAAWLIGLGAPWNTLQLGGSLRLASPGLSLEVANGRWRFIGQAELELNNLSSRLSTLERLGSYRLLIDGSSATPTVRLSTQDGALLLSGDGQWTDSRFRFRGEARAAPGFESALDNLLNILGKRQGAVSVLSIG